MGNLAARVNEQRVHMPGGRGRTVQDGGWWGRRERGLSGCRRRRTQAPVEMRQAGCGGDGAMRVHHEVSSTGWVKPAA